MSELIFEDEDVESHANIEYNAVKIKITRSKTVFMRPLRRIILTYLPHCVVAPLAGRMTWASASTRKTSECSTAGRWM